MGSTHGSGTYGALNAAAERALDRGDAEECKSLLGKMAILEARASGVTDPEQLRAASRAAKAGL